MRHHTDGEDNAAKFRYFKCNLIKRRLGEIKEDASGTADKQSVEYAFHPGRVEWVHIAHPDVTDAVADYGCELGREEYA